MQEDNHSNLSEDLTRLLGSALGTAQSVKQDVHTQIRHYIEDVIKKIDIVPREEFEIVKDMLSKARQEQETLALRLKELEQKIEESND